MQMLNNLGRCGANQKQEALPEVEPLSQSLYGSGGGTDSGGDGGCSGSLRTSKTNLRLAWILPTTFILGFLASMSICIGSKIVRELHSLI